MITLYQSIAMEEFKICVGILGSMITAFLVGLLFIEVLGLNSGDPTAGYDNSFDDDDDDERN